MVVGATDLHRRHLGSRLFVDEALLAGQALEFRVVEHDRHPVGREVDVALDRIIALDCCARRREGVLPAGLVHVMIAAMGNRPLRQPRDVGHVLMSVWAGYCYLSSTIASISTGALSGRTATPTAE